MSKKKKITLTINTNKTESEYLRNLADWDNKSVNPDTIIGGGCGKKRTS